MAQFVQFASHRFQRFRVDWEVFTALADETDATVYVRDRQILLIVAGWALYGQRDATLRITLKVDFYRGFHKCLKIADTVLSLNQGAL